MAYYAYASSHYGKVIKAFMTEDSAYNWCSNHGIQRIEVK